MFDAPATELTQFGDGASDLSTPVITQCFLLEDSNGNVSIEESASYFERTKAAQAENVPANLGEVLRFAGGSEGTTGVRAHQQDLPVNDEVQPPYDPSIASYMGTVDEVAHRCIQVKSSDVICKGWSLTPVKIQSLTPEEGDEPSEKDASGASATAVAQQTAINTFIKTCNSQEGFVPAVHRAVLDCETYGWAALEVTRGADFEVKSLKHIPAARVRVLKGWKGFVENCDNGKKVYYQSFGDKVRSKSRTDVYTKEPLAYDPELDGELSPSTCEWRFVDYQTGKATGDFAESASELLWVVKPHPATLHYGVTDSIPVSGQILANVQMREYLRQFFEHNAVPRYAIIIKGANLDASVQNAIMAYFNSHVKGRAHKTMIIPLPTARGNVDIVFEKLEMSTNEQWFTEPSKEASQSTRLSHGVAAAVAGFSEAASLGSGKGMAQSEVYKDRTVAPLQGIWANAINKLFRLGLGVTEIEFSLSPLDVKDRDTEHRIYTDLLDRGAASLNEVRAALKLGPPIKGGNRYFIKTPGGILFVDELEGMKSGPVGGVRPQGAGGDRTAITATKKPPENGLENIKDGTAAGIK